MADSDVLEALRDGPARISDLAAPFSMTFAGVSRQIGVLERAGLAQREVRGREHWISARPEGLAEAQRWVVFTDYQLIATQPGSVMD